jgi:hypothetical protein
MLLVVGTYAAVIRATINGLCMRPDRVFAGFIVVPYLFVIFDIDGNKHFLKTMFLTGLGKIYIPILKDDLSAYLPVAFNAKADCMVIINIIPLIFHVLLLRRS